MGDVFKGFESYRFLGFKMKYKFYPANFLPFLLVILAVMGIENRAHAVVGATVPFTSYEGESGALGGGAAIVSVTAAPTTPYSSPELEASGHAYVQLNAIGQSVTWTNNIRDKILLPSISGRASRMLRPAVE